MSHLVRCRGEEWRFGRLGASGSIFHLLGLSVRTELLLEWTGFDRNRQQSDHPAWLPAAWLCCEADPAEGPKFAAAILDAGPGDDATALIAAEWLEERGTEGRFEVEFAERELAITFASDPIADWELIPLGQIHPRTGNAVVAGRGPLASWCRHLIDTRCVACGGRRDGFDELKVLAGFVYGPLQVASYHRYSLNQKTAPGFKRVTPAPCCPLCGFPAHTTPPLLAIPEVVSRLGVGG